jgi:hypothetical protein
MKVHVTRCAYYLAFIVEAKSHAEHCPGQNAQATLPDPPSSNAVISEFQFLSGGLPEPLPIPLRYKRIARTGIAHTCVDRPTSPGEACGDDVRLIA